MIHGVALTVPEPGQRADWPRSWPGGGLDPTAGVRLCGGRRSRHRHRLGGDAVRRAGHPVRGRRAAPGRRRRAATALLTALPSTAGHRGPRRRGGLARRRAAARRRLDRRREAAAAADWAEPPSAAWTWPGRRRGRARAAAGAAGRDRSPLPAPPARRSGSRCVACSRCPGWACSRVRPRVPVRVSATAPGSAWTRPAGEWCAAASPCRCWSERTSDGPRPGSGQPGGRVRRQLRHRQRAAGQQQFTRRQRDRAGRAVQRADQRGARPAERQAPVRGAEPLQGRAR